MTYGFHRSRRGIVADLTEQEQGILLGLLQQTAELLEPKIRDAVRYRDM